MSTLMTETRAGRGVEFTDGTPFGHLDIRGPMVFDTDDGWRPTGDTGFATRLLSSFACNFRRSAPSA